MARWADPSRKIAKGVVAMRVHLLAVPYDSGHRSVRMGNGPGHFIQNGVEEELRAEGHQVTVQFIESADSFKAEIRTAFELYRLLAVRVRMACEDGSFPLVISGNCGSSLGTISGVPVERIGVIWLDGHGDFNTPDTSSSGFLDGMGLATVAGLCWKSLAESIPEFKAVPAENILHIGGRDFDHQERELLDRSGITVVDAELIKKTAIQETLAPAFERLIPKVEQVYLHIDLDVLNPIQAPANEYAPAGGLSVEQVESVIQMVGERFEICASGIAAYDPNYDGEDQTLGAGIRLIKTVLNAARK
jgi:arginase